MALNIFLVSAGLCQSEPKKILLIGNSLTYYNNLPIVLQDMFKNYGVDIKVFNATLPGVDLKWLATMARPESIVEAEPEPNQVFLCAKLLSEHKFDYVLLQEQTIRLLIPEEMEKSKKYFQELSDIFKKTGSTILIYQNYPICRYPATHCYPNFNFGKQGGKDIFCSEEIKNSKQEMTLLKNAIDSISIATGGIIVPIGEAFEISKQCSSEPVRIGEHPSKLGSYIIATLIFNIVANKKINPNDHYFETNLGNRMIVETICEELLKK